jgi:prepilin-type N-terminal cleavage/methylation domain-containing protein
MFNHKYQKGFSLIEVLIALFILGVGMAVLFNLFPMGWQALAYSRKLNEVYLLVQKKMEEIKREQALQPGETSGEEGDLNWSVNVKPLRLEDTLEVIQVQLDVDFEFQKIPQKQRFITYLPENEE